MRRALVIAALAAMAAAEGKLPDAEWRGAAAQAKRLMRKPGRLSDAEDAIAALARDDSRRAAALLVQWADRSLKRQKGPIRRDIERAREDFRKLDERMRRKYGRTPPPSQEDFDTWNEKNQAYRDAVRRRRDEDKVQGYIGAACGRVRDPAALALLDDPKARDVKRARESRPLREGWVGALLERGGSGRIPRLLAFAGDADLPRARLRILELVRTHRVAEGFPAAVECLRAEETALRRAAVLTLRVLDRPEAVPPLIDALKTASGLLREELEAALHHFTGQSLGPFHDVWERWWAREGAAWLARRSARRFAEEQRKKSARGASFYGIVTRSDRIVFVLDRSGSMRHPVPAGRGPTTGKGRDDRVPGKTKLEVAKNQLARSIGRLTPDVSFGVVFYSGDVQTWKKPPLLMAANADNKRRAKDWFMRLPPEGSTRMFDALRRALAYATVEESGADTIFLLSDGAPTEGDALLTGEALEREYRDFVQRNRLVRCVVHTIGIGPGHNRRLMERIARETGGTYRAVGVD